jgi:hypothetical protein
MLRGSGRDDRLSRLDLLGRTNEYGSRLGECCRGKKFEGGGWIANLTHGVEIDEGTRFRFDRPDDMNGKV